MKAKAYYSDVTGKLTITSLEKRTVDTPTLREILVNNEAILELLDSHCDPIGSDNHDDATLTFDNATPYGQFLSKDLIKLTKELKEKGLVVDGFVRIKGESEGDMWEITIENNKVSESYPIRGVPNRK